jgi:hypothetical protein
LGGEEAKPVDEIEITVALMSQKIKTSEISN